MAGRRGGYRAPRDYDPRRGGAKRAGGDVRGRAGEVRGGQRTHGSDDTGRDAGHGAVAVPSSPALKAPLPAPLDARITRPEDVAGTSFAELGLGGNIVRALAELGAKEPFAIQVATIPDALAGHHVLGRGRTGSGKTIAFGAALVERLLRLKAAGVFPDERPREKPQRGTPARRPDRSYVRRPKALILAPTRELALQIDRTVQPIARSVGLFTGQFVGGQPFEPQLHALQRGVDIAIGTPGRIEDLAKRGHLALGGVAVTVIDEADHLAELGFIEPVRRILRQTRRGGQRMLFSATLDSGVDELVREFLPRPAVHEVVDDRAGGAGGRERSSSTPGAPAPGVDHRVLIVLREHKEAALVQLAGAGGRTIVFCRTRTYVDRLAEAFTAAGIVATPLHGDLGQARRERNLARFAEGRARVLVATDIAARGIHVDDVELVLQADPPDDPKTYLHRAGRTGRAGAGGGTGTVLTVIPRTRQKRTRELFDALGFEPAFFGDFVPEAAGGDPAHGA